MKQRPPGPPGSPPFEGAGGYDPDRLEELFAQGCELSGSEREVFLREVAPESRLREELESLLAAHDQTRGQIEVLDARHASRLLDSTRAESAALTIGPYRVVRTLGEGGMGTVFLADRIEGGFEQQVALKLVKKGMDSEAIVERFRQERQILAQLRHPGIIQLFDGGLSADGRPFFAMEYVDGQSIIDYCREHDLGTDARVELFLKVCDAVQTAHRNLVVHRDLKPSNILVNREGGAKLVDFGIAKVLDAVGGAGAGPFTRIGARALTPEYASPEQILGQPVTTASDVYGLGVVLFELLTGSLPYDAELTTHEQVARAVCETEPLVASVAVRRHADTELTQRVSRHLAGDLDAILAKALAKDVERRYLSVEALADDLRRHQQGIPVQARPPGTMYRVGRFVRRHKLGVVLGGTLLLALVLGLLGTSWQASVAASERSRAEAELVKAEAVQEFLTSLLQSIDPYRTAGKPWTADQLLDRGVEQIEQGVAAAPEVEADLLGVMGGVSRSLGQFERAEQLWRRALAIRRQQSPVNDAEVAEGLRGLAKVLYYRDQHEESTALLEEALQIEQARRRNGSEASPDPLWQTLEQLAVERHELGRFTEARALYEEALSLVREKPGDQRGQIAQMWVNLANLDRETGNLAAAEVLLREALEVEREVLGPKHPAFAITLGTLGMTLRQRGHLDEAEPLYREALAVARAAFGDEHPEVSTKLNNLAALQRARGQYDEAATLFAQVLEFDRTQLGANHVYVGFSMDNLAVVLAELGQFDEALALFEGAHRILVAGRGPVNKDVATNLLGTAVALRLRGEPGRSVELLGEAHAIYTETLPAGHARIAETLAELGDARADLGRDAEAERDYREALRMRRELGQASHPETVGAVVGLGRLLLRTSRTREALELLEEASRMASTTLPERHWRRCDADLALASALAAVGEGERARSLAEAAALRLASQTGLRAERLRVGEARLRAR